MAGQFSPILWNVFDEHTYCPRTNNNLEGWHDKLKRIARKAHVNIYEIVLIFKNVGRQTDSAAQVTRSNMKCKYRNASRNTHFRAF